MPNKNLKFFLKKAQKEKWAVGQFNFSNLETLKAIVEAAKKLKSPVIIGTSERESKLIGLERAAALAKLFGKESGIPVFLNLDHGKSLDYIKKAIRAGYDSVHFDGSELPLEENIKITKQIVGMAGKKSVSVEGEVGMIYGSSRLLKKAPEIKEKDLTSPEEAFKFVKETGVERIAVNIGSFHGLAKTGPERLDFERLKELKRKIGKRAALVLHGGSGIAEKEIKEAIKFGIVKININTELRLAFARALKKTFKKFPGEVAPYKYMPSVISACQRVVEAKIKLFNSDSKI